MKNEINRPPMAVILAAGSWYRLAAQPADRQLPKEPAVCRWVGHSGADDPQFPELRHVPVRVGVGS